MGSSELEQRDLERRKVRALEGIERHTKSIADSLKFIKEQIKANRSSSKFTEADNEPGWTEILTGIKKENNND